VYERCRKYREANWALLDEVLYRLCADHPSHLSRDAVNAKVTVIGRTYATGIERMVPSDRTQASSMDKVARLLHSRGAEIDHVVKRLGQLSEPLTVDSLRAVVEEHGRVVAILKNVVRPNRTPRSFASKYLHFHTPIVPVYDSYAAKALARLARSQYDPAVLGDVSGEPVYADFIAQFWWLYSAATRLGLNPAVKVLDYFLLSSSGSA
jgi:hypothetical protein